MSYKKQLQVNSRDDYESVQIHGPSNYEEIDALFSKYCKEVSGLKSHDVLTLKPPLRKNGSPLSSRSKANTTTHKQLHARGGLSNSERGVNKHFPITPISTMHHINASENQLPSDKRETYQGKERVSSFQFNSLENEIAQMAKDFDIPPAAFASISSPKEKEKFVLEYIRKVVRDELKELTKKHSMKMHQSKKFEKEIQRMKDKAEREKNDIFKWLNVPTEFDSLKKKLRAKIVDAIHENANHEVIGKALDELSKSKDNINLSSSEKLTLENIPTVNNFELLGGVLEEDQSRMLKTTRSAKLTQNKNMQSFQSNHAPSTNSFMAGNQSSANLQLVGQGSSGLNENSPLETQYFWDDIRELIFSSHRTDAKSRLFQQVKSSNWNDLGFSPLIQAFITKEKSKSERDTILKRYINGDLLSKEEYKFIASTSTALNSCVDKKFLQKVVNNLDPDTINALELDLAETILKEYKRVRKQVNDARQEHLKEENKKLIDRVQKKEEHFQQKIMLENNRRHQKQIKTRIVGYLNKLEEKKRWRKPQSQGRDPEMESDISMMRSFQHEFVPPKKEEEEDEIKNRPRTQADFLRAFVRTPNEPKSFNLKLSQHHYHPSSKVFLFSDPQQKDFMGLETHFTDQNSQVQVENLDEMKLNIHAPRALKDKQNFRGYYSGGPIDNGPLLFQGNFIYGDVSQYKVNEYQKHVLVKIQAVWRGYSQRQKFKQMLIQYREAQKKNNYSRENPILSRTLSHSKVVTPQSRPHFGNENFTNKLMLSNHEDFGRAATLTEIERGTVSGRHTNKSGDSRFAPALRHNVNPRGTNENRLQHQTTFDDNVTQINEKFYSPKVGKLRPLTAQMKGRVRTATTKETENSTMIHHSRISRKPEEISKAVISEGDGVFMNARMVAISKKQAPKGLLLKQRKLFVAAKANNINMITSSGYHYFETDANVKDDNNNTPLFYAAMNGSKEICEFLLGCGARVNEPCSDGNTPLHMAFASNNVMVAIMLISKGGNLNTLNHSNQTPIAFGSESMITLLGLKNGVATFDKSITHQDFDNNHLLTRVDQNSFIHKHSMLFKYRPLEQATSQVVDERNNLHTFMSLNERTIQKLKK